MDRLNQLIDFLDRLEAAKIYYQLNKVRDGIMVEIAVPGQRWEVEFMADGGIEVEKFVSNSEIFGESEIDAFFETFSD